MAVDRDRLNSAATKGEVAEIAGSCALLSALISQLCDELPGNDKVKKVDEEVQRLMMRFDQQFDALSGWKPDAA